MGLLGVPPIAQAQVENLVLNPSFEEDEVILDDPAWEQWTTWGWEAGLHSTVEFDEDESVDGTRSLRIEATGGTNWYFIVLQDNLPFTVGQPHTASFWVKAEAPRPVTAKFKATDNSVDWGQTDFDVTTEWAEYSMTSVAQNASVKLEIFCAAEETPFWLDFVNVYEGEYVAGIMPSGAGGRMKATAPSPADGAVIEETYANLAWKAGDSAALHRVYLGESLDDVSNGAEGTLTGTYVGTTLMIGIPEAPMPEGLSPGATYYWRVDEVNDADPNSPWQGDVWSFMVRPLVAWNPSPADGVPYVTADQHLAWDIGMDVLFHNVYFGESFDEVANAVAGGWMTVDTTYDPGPLEVGKTYYWRVDEFTGLVTHTGDVWSFTTVPEIEVADPDLLGWWTLDEGAGTTAVDWSGHDNHGQFVGDPEWTYGVQGGALALEDGAHVQMAAPNVQTNTATMTAWAKRNGGQSDWAAILFSRAGSAVSGVGFGPSNELRYHWTNQYWDFATGIVPPDQEWFFVALVIEPTQGTLYYNGTDTSVQNVAAHDPDPFDGALLIGRDAQGGRDLEGAVDDVRFYNKALNAQELMAVMRGDLTLAWNPTPAPDAVLDIRDAISLSWSAGDAAASHDVYLGTSREAVAAAGADSAEYQGNRTATSLSLAGLVELGGGDYYWRIDEVEADGTVNVGFVWKFAILPYLLVDDFESYTNDSPNRVFQTWVDGLGFSPDDHFPNGHAGNGTGAIVGYDPLSGQIMETRLVHSPSQSMPVQYDNTAAPGHSHALRTFSPAQNWTVEGVTKLVIHFRGDPDNTGSLYAEINGTRVTYDGDPADIASADWIAWSIDLASTGVTLTNVRTLAIGVEGGETGIVYVDDVYLTVP
jgi:hypothetical protein